MVSARPRWIPDTLDFNNIVSSKINKKRTLANLAHASVWHLNAGGEPHHFKYHTKSLEPAGRPSSCFTVKLLA